MLSLAAGRSDKFLKWTVLNGQLYKETVDNTNPMTERKCKLVIPKELTKQVLWECYDNPTAGHLGTLKTTRRVTENQSRCH